jgi:hypothetical protein
MKTILVALLLGITVLPPYVCAQNTAVPDVATTVPAADSVEATESKQMEKDLQRLPWPQFRAVVEAVPKLRAGVEAYGTAGWQLVQANYKHYPWHKNIDKLDAAQKQQLAELIREAKAAP